MRKFERNRKMLENLLNKVESELDVIRSEHAFEVYLPGITYDKEEEETYGSSTIKEMRLRLDSDLNVELIEVSYSLDSSYAVDEFESFGELRESCYATAELLQVLPFLAA